MKTTHIVDNSPRDKAAATMMTLTTYTSDGTEKERFTFKVNRVVVGVVLAAFAWLALTEGIDELVRRQHQEEVAEMRPFMEKLASEGKVAASLWLAQNYAEDNHQRLEQLATDGSPEAMLLQGIALLRSGDKEGGMRWLEKSAASGYAPAIRIVQRSEAEKKRSG